jgi:hypothetical protein
MPTVISNQTAAGPAVMTLGEMDVAAVARLLGGFDLRLVMLAADADIPGTYWGAPEAGLSGDQLLVRPDTPVHSVLHEAAHFICMSSERRHGLYRDAGGDVAEEDAVCYLQILLAAKLAAPGWSRERLFADMDAWGYSFRLGSTRRWFEQDADEALRWLEHRGLIEKVEK